MNNPIGLYVHIPFCLRKCNYCDFCSFAGVDGETRARYIDALCEEIASYRDEKNRLDTVFFGGGTPSLLTPEETARVMGAIRDAFEILPNAEITLESNPKTLTAEKLKACRTLGFNRLSIGLQSANDEEEKILGRVHTFSDFLSSFQMARKAGFDNINVDLIYGIPAQSLESFERTLDAVLSLSPEHLSCYGLILEEGTPFWEERGNLAFPDEDEERAMYLLAAKKLADGGYRHYEISNYAKPGFESRHNLHYWRDESYLGVGMAAHSFFRGARFGNTERFDEYFDKNRAQYRAKEDSLGEEDAFEYAMLRLRLADGMSLSEYRTRFGRDFLDTEEKRKKASLYRENGDLTLDGDRLSLTDRGFYISNAILSDLL